MWSNPDVDMFATRLNAKLPCYVAWKPDPGAIAIDAFTTNLSGYTLIYCFPPFKRHWKSSTKDCSELCYSHTCTPRLANSVLVSIVTENAAVSTTHETVGEDISDTASQQNQSTSTTSKTQTDWLSCVKQTLVN